jgi:Flp pilus assembly protein TadD
MKNLKNILLIPFIIVSLSLSGQSPVNGLLMGKSLIDRGLQDEAINVITQALGSENDYRLYLLRAEAKESKGDYAEAISDLNEANRIVPNSGEFGLSRIYAIKGDPQTSLYHLDLNLGSGFRKSEKDVLLNPAFGAIENKAEWRNFWKKDHYTELERKVSEIEYLTSAGKTEESRQVLSELQSNYPKADELIYSEALVQLASGKYSDAARLIAGLTAGNPDNEKYNRLLAKAQELSSNPAGASQTYTRLIESRIVDAGLFLSRAECYRKTGENDKALADIRTYLQYYPDSKSAISLAGKTEAVTGDNLKAIEFFSKNLELHPNDADCYIDRGNSYLVSKSWDFAIKDYSMSLDLKPGNPDVWLNKGIALLGKGMLEDACHDFRRSLAMGNKRASELISRNCIK